MAVGLARLAGVHGQALHDLSLGALLHDIGKLAIPDAILLKPGKLDEDEMAVMRKHPQLGYELTQKVDFLREAGDIPHSHHERWDGTGYPQGLRGEQIPLAARIFSIVDVWDALITPRVYKAAWPEAEVLATCRRCWHPARPAPGEAVRGSLRRLAAAGPAAAARLARSSFLHPPPH